MLYHVTSQWRVSNLIIPIPIAQASRPIQALQTGQFSNTREDFEFPDRSTSPPFNTDPDFHSIHHGPPHRFLELLRFVSSPTRAKSLLKLLSQLTLLLQASPCASGKSASRCAPSSTAPRCGRTPSMRSAERASETGCRAWTTDRPRSWASGRGLCWRRGRGRHSAMLRGDRRLKLCGLRRREKVLEGRNVIKGTGHTWDGREEERNIRIVHTERGEFRN